MPSRMSKTVILMNHNFWTQVESDAPMCIVNCKQCILYVNNNKNTHNDIVNFDV